MHIMGHAGVISKKTYISKPRWKEGRVKERKGGRDASRNVLERGTRQGMRWEEGRVGKRDTSLLAFCVCIRVESARTRHPVCTSWDMLVL